METKSASGYLPPEISPERVAARIGLISDTHMPERCAALPPALFDVFNGIDLLLHAGDVGELWVLDRLSAIAPVVAVHGNDDTADAQRELPYQQVMAIRGQRILLTHAHYPDREQELASRRIDDWAPKLERRGEMGRRAGARIVVFGHTHVPMAREHEGLLLINPGAVASGSAVTRQRRQTAALLFVLENGATLVAHVDLAAPTERFVPQIDWQAGFRAALEQYSESILAPELEAIWPELVKQVWDPAPGPVKAAIKAALLRAAHRRWAAQGDGASGRWSPITREELLSEMREEAALASTEFRVLGSPNAER